MTWEDVLGLVLAVGAIYGFYRYAQYRKANRKSGGSGSGGKSGGPDVHVK